MRIYQLDWVALGDSIVDSFNELKSKLIMR